MILVVTPTTTNSGNGVTARRWAAIVRALGHQTEISTGYCGGQYEALIALHARKSEKAIRSFSADHPGKPIVIAMTGTDLYPDPVTAGVDPAVLALASRFIVLQRHGLAALGTPWADRALVIRQSMPVIPREPPKAGYFEVAYLAHIRAVKDPLRLAQAVRLLPASSRIRVTHAGDASDHDLAARAAAESAGNPRYDWLGPLPRPAALSLLARSALLAVTSWSEGGANVVTEAVAAGVPVISARIGGSVGLLGEDYPGYFPAGDEAALASLLAAAEAGLHADLRQRVLALRPLVDPAVERAAFAALLGELRIG